MCPCTFKTSPCVPAPRAHVETHVRVVRVHTATSRIYTRWRVGIHTRCFFHVFQHAATHTPLPLPVCAFKMFPCVPATCPHVETHVRVVPAYTETFLNPHTGFSTFFSVPQHTQYAHQHITNTQQTTAPHNATHCTHARHLRAALGVAAVRSVRCDGVRCRYLRHLCSVQLHS